MSELIEQKTVRQNREALIEKCRSAGVPAGPINSVAETFADPQITARRMQLEIWRTARFTHAHFDGRQLFCPERPPPKLGEHTTRYCVNWE